jgi:hypothetical protein
MVVAIAINVGIVLLGLGIASRVVPTKVVSGMIGVLHKIVGITLPPPEKERTVALVWIGSALVLGDGMLLLLVFITRAVVKG